MSENTAISKEDRTIREVPDFDPDDQLMADLEGSEAAVRAYRREGEALRRDAART